MWKNIEKWLITSKLHYKFFSFPLLILLLSFHSFRHTYAVLQLAAGTSIYTVSKMMLHKSIHSTEIYLDLLEKTKLETIGRISIYIDPDMFEDEK